VPEEWAGEECEGFPHAPALPVAGPTPSPPELLGDEFPAPVKWPGPDCDPLPQPELLAVPGLAPSAPERPVPEFVVPLGSEKEFPPECVTGASGTVLIGGLATLGRGSKFLAGRGTVLRGGGSCGWTITGGGGAMTMGGGGAMIIGAGAGIGAKLLWYCANNSMGHAATPKIASPAANGKSLLLGIFMRKTLRPRRYERQAESPPDAVFRQLTVNVDANARPACEAQMTPAALAMSWRSQFRILLTDYGPDGLAASATAPDVSMDVSIPGYSAAPHAGCPEIRGLPTILHHFAAALAYRKKEQT